MVMPLTTAQDWIESRPWIDCESADVRSYVARVSEQAGFDLLSKLQEWRERGVVIFERVVDEALIDALLNDIEYLRRHHRDFELGAELKGVQKSIAEFSATELDSDGVKFNSIHSISLAAAMLSLTGEVTTFLRHIFESPPCVLQSLTFYRGSQQPAHIDYPYVRCQTRLAHLAASWIPLEDIHADSGPLAYYPGSHRTELSGFFDWGQGSILLEPGSERSPQEFADYLRSRMRACGIERKIFLPKRGDVLLWHGNLVHEGTVIQDPARTRKSYVTHYTSLQGYPPAHRRADGAGVSAHGGFAYDYPWLCNPRQLPSGGQR
jgi:ectoine hydroxylase-related dioxygenase (phytanoyl-CoA dioxygenase family)